MSNDDELLEFCVEIHNETDLALLVSEEDGKTQIWLRKSRIEDFERYDYVVGDVVTIKIPEWLAIEKGLV